MATQYQKQDILDAIHVLKRENVITKKEIDLIKTCWESIKHNNDYIFTKSEPQ